MALLVFFSFGFQDLFRAVCFTIRKIEKMLQNHSENQLIAGHFQATDFNDEYS